MLALDVEHAHDAAAADQRKDEFGANLFIHLNVAWLSLDFGNELGLAVGVDPADDALADRDGHPGDVHAVTAVSSDSEFLGIAAGQQYRNHVIAHHVADDVDDAR